MGRPKIGTVRWDRIGIVRIYLRPWWSCGCILYEVGVGVGRSFFQNDFGLGHGWGVPFAILPWVPRLLNLLFLILVLDVSIPYSFVSEC